MLMFCWLLMKLLGPRHEYELPADPLRAIVPPAQISTLVGLMLAVDCRSVTWRLAVAVQMPLPTVTLYTPEYAVLLVLRLAVAVLAVKPLGPLQLYGLPPLAMRFNAVPTHRVWALFGLMPAVGLVLTVALAVAVALQLLLLLAVTVKLYPPAMLLLNVAELVLLTKVPPLLAQV